MKAIINVVKNAERGTTYFFAVVNGHGRTLGGTEELLFTAEKEGGVNCFGEALEEAKAEAARRKIEVDWS